jgi:transposase
LYAQAAYAVRARIDTFTQRVDWKYALSLELEDFGFDFSVLTEYCGRLIEGDAESLLLDRMLQVFAQRKLLKARGRHITDSTDSTPVLAAIRTMNRLEVVTETMRAGLNSPTASERLWYPGIVNDPFLYYFPFCFLFCFLYRCET